MTHLDIDFLITMLLKYVLGNYYHSMIETCCLKNVVIFIQTILCFVLSREIDSLLVNIKTEMQSKFDDINNRLNVVKNNIKGSINDQVNESMSSIKDSIINALKDDDNKKLHSKTEDLEMKLHESESSSLNSPGQYNRRNNIEIQGIP